jgi:DMSO reductase anchor subunit
VAAKYILAALAIVFLIAAFTRGGHDRMNPLGRTWLLIAVLFGLVSAWLFYQG